MIRCLSSFTRNSDFLPSAGFKVVSSGVRCIILFYTADNQIRTLKFENIVNSVAENKPPQKTYDCQLQDESTIKAIITSSANTFGLLDDGRMFYFVSYRSVEVIPNLRNVRAICQSDNGFAVIRNSSSVVVVIELYSDRGSNEMLKKYKRIPISWEEERWCFERDTEKSVIQLVRLNVEAVKELFHKFLVQVDPEETPNAAEFGKVVVFSSNCSLFCVFYENAKDAHSEVFPIRTFLSPVDSVQIFTSGIMCVVLASGVVELLYVDKERELKGDSIFLGLNDIYAMETIPADECIYFSDKSQLVKVSFDVRTEEERSVTWTVDRSMNMPGIIGISYLPAIQAVLCLSENYFVYAIQHKAATEAGVAVEGKSEELNDLEVLKRNLLELNENHDKLMMETDNSTAINVMLYPEALRESCKVILSFKAYTDDYDEEPSLGDKTSDQLYDICLEFQCGLELLEVFSAPGQWSLQIEIRGGVEPEEFHETIRLDETFLKRGRVKLLRRCSRNNGRLGADFAINIQGFVESAEKLLVKVPLRVAYNVSSIVEVLEEDPLEMMVEGWSKFEIATDNKTILNNLLDMIIEQRINLEPFVIAIGRSAIVVNVGECSCAFRCDDPSALQLLKRLLLLEGHNREIFTKIEYAPKETLALSELSMRHALFGDSEGALKEVFDEVYKDLTSCKIKLS